jgi:hypothetical protein
MFEPYKYTPQPLASQAIIAATEQVDGAACIAMRSARIVRLSPARPRRQVVMVRISASHGRSRPFALSHEDLESLMRIAVTLDGAR